MHAISRAPTCGVYRAGDERGPNVDVLARIAHDRWFACGAARGMQPHNLFARNRKQPEGIVGTEVLFYQEWDARQVLERSDLVRMYLGDLEAAPVVLDVMIGVAQTPSQSFKLQCAQLINA